MEEKQKRSQYLHITDVFQLTVHLRHRSNKAFFNKANNRDELSNTVIQKDCYCPPNEEFILMIH